MKDAQSESLGPAIPRNLRESGLDPYPWYAEMRETSPVRYDEEHDVWDVFRFDDVKRVLGDDVSFSAADVSHFDPNEKLPARTMMDSDPPDHGRLRGVVDDFFTPGNLRTLEPTIEGIVEERLDRITEGNEFDFAEELARSVTLSTIMVLLGIPSEGGEWEQFRDWQEDMHFDPAREDGEIDERVRRAREATKKMIDYFGELLDRRADEPRDDVVSVITNTDSDDQVLTREEKLSFCVLLLRGGNNTTTVAMTNTFWTLAEEGLMDEYLAGEVDPASTFEEVLRYRSPVQMIPARATTTEVEIADTVIPAGERMRPWIGAANRDPRQFENPERFDPNRKPNAHIAFGTGIHYCLGAPLAKLEGRIVLDVIQRRADEVNVRTGDLDRNESPLLRPKELPTKITL